ncbi:MAG: SH3 domain-containing protein [Pseudomonadales bacterium]|nr:SH3 domain-containing protein [Pseudomonadales bacterium]
MWRQVISKRVFLILVLVIASLSRFSLADLANEENDVGGETTEVAEAKEKKEVKVKPMMRVEVIDPYVDMRTGPGRGYPVFNVVEQGEVVTVIKRKPDWYQITSKNGKTGWTTALQLSRTLKTSGIPVKLPNIGYGQYQKNRLRVGFSSGQFMSGELKGAETFSVTAGYRAMSWLGIELAGGKLYKTDVSGSHYGMNLILEPSPRWSVVPYAVMGYGIMTLETQPGQADVKFDDSKFNIMGAGVSYYLGSNFVFRGEYRHYSVSASKGDNIDEKESLGEWKLGFNTFF